MIKEPDSGRKILGKFRNRVANAVSSVHQSDEISEVEPRGLKRR